MHTFREGSSAAQVSLRAARKQQFYAFDVMAADGIRKRSRAVVGTGVRIGSAH